MGSPTRILVVEDEANIAEVVQSYLEREGHVVARAATGEDALDDFSRHRPDLVVLDLGLPGLPGDEVCRRIRAGSDVPIIMLTAKDGEEDLVRGLELGADDYLTKPFSPRELTARVRALLRRARSDDEPQADVLERADGRLAVDSARRSVTLDGRVIDDLTESEFRLLQVLARFPGRVYTRLELVGKVQGYGSEGYERTIDAHVKNLRHKLGDDARAPQLILTVYGRGYAFAEDRR
jgi:two-component system response regulator RegX3